MMVAFVFSSIVIRSIFINSPFSRLFSHLTITNMLEINSPSFR